jgi:excinuclease ABC subunit A
MKKENLRAFPEPGCVIIRGARQNNLKGIDLDLPLGKLNVISGPSGSGKSSLAFDTIYAEGQRRYVETFSPYTRQFLERMDKPQVDEIRGIPPAIAIEQSNTVKSSRSTVGTMTEINDYLKLLMPRVARAFCPSCGREIRPETAPSIVEQVVRQHAGETAWVVFGVQVPAKTKPGEFFEFLQQQGYLRVWIGGEIHRTDEPLKLQRLPAVVRVIQDRMAVSAENKARLSEAVETALRFGKGQVAFVVGNEEHPFSTGWHCAHCDQEITPPSPGLFSFNNPLGACPKCRGFGRTIGIDIGRAIPDRSRSIFDGAVKVFQTESGQECQRDLLKFCAENEIDVHCPFEKLPRADQEFVMQGDRREGETSEELWSNQRWYGVRGFFDWLEKKTYKMHVRVLLSRYRSYNLCEDCHGGRFQPATLNFKFQGTTLPELTAMPAGALLALFERGSSASPPSDRNDEKADLTTEMLRKEVATRLRYLVDVGLGYLSLDRPTRTLSGGEVERVNLTTCLGASLVNTLFVMDEPTVGLHPRDVGRLISVMKNLRDKGNTLLVVEHEESVIRAADNIVELGPGRGEKGGELVFNGPVPALMRERKSLTAAYLARRKSIPAPKKRRTPKAFIKVQGASQHNLRNIDVDIPLSVFACVTGVSGSGKSTLVNDVLFQNLQHEKGVALDETKGACRKITGTHRVHEVVLVDQSPLSRTPRSSPAVYLGVFDHIRALFGALPEAQEQGLTAGSFSFNSGDGRCERCGGNGFEKIEMQFLSDLFVRCPECTGKKFQPHILKIKLRGKSIHELLELSVAEAIRFFDELKQPEITKPLGVLEEVGLGYLRLGQPLNVLSGGESQRLKLVGHLTTKVESNNLLIFDEPTTGLHFDDVAMLLKVFNRLVEQGNSVVVIEHNLEVIKSADYLIDLGPEAGEEGGLVVATGTPEEVAEVQHSHTGKFLRVLLSAAKHRADHAMRRVERPFLYAQDDIESSRIAEEPRPVTHSPPSTISIHGAREHNLKNLSLAIPRDKMVIITGLSGSGKSTLAFDILFAEGQRRFLDSMSAYARQFVEQLEKPDVDLLTGLPPTVAIEQRVTRGGGKSTVATVTEVYHFLRLLFAKLGTQHCPKCGLPVQSQSVGAITRQAEALARKGRMKVLAPLVKARKGFHTDVAKWAVNHGFESLLVDGKFVKAAGFKKLERFKEHTIDVVVGESGSKKPLKEILQRALEIGRGTARLLDSRNRATIFSTEMSCPGCGQSFEELDPRLFSFNSPHGWCEGCNGFGEVWNAVDSSDADTVLEAELHEERQHEWLDPDEATPCPLCHGARLKATARNVRLHGTTIQDFTAQSAGSALKTLGRFKFDGERAVIAKDIVPEIAQRLQFMGKVGLDYLALNRSAKTLSGGESQRIRLAAQLGSNLRGVLYVLDEPTIGLHPRDNQALLDTLEALKQKGNSLVVVEHDEETMRRADEIIDLGPGAGMHGGEVVAQGTIGEIMDDSNSATGRCLKVPLVHPTTGARRSIKCVEHWLKLKGAHANNLQDIDVRFPIGRLSVITGISGCGKSSLMRGVLLKAARQRLGRDKGEIKELASIEGVEFLEAVYEVDQSPIGKTSRSTPATYIKVFDEIRKLYAQLPVARMRGYSASRFSFNAEGGRCPTCMGQGVIKVEMNFLPTSYLPCTDCRGLRYNPPTLEVLYDNKSIGDVMDMTIEQAAGFFRANPKIHRPLSLLVDTGLGYLKLGQPSPTLSGGEAQRLKLVSELTRGVTRAQNDRIRRQRQSKSMLYLLEEPTIGLHMADVAQLLKVLHRLVDEGNTVIVIEHNLSLIADADYIVDLGPEAGENGGRVVATGTPEQVAKSKLSRTAPFLREVLSKSGTMEPVAAHLS